MHGEQGSSTISTRGACALGLLVVLACIAAFVPIGRDEADRALLDGGQLPQRAARDIVDPVHVTVHPRLAPGESHPVNLLLRNPHGRPLTVTALTLRVRRVRAPRADAAHTCGVADFSVAQVSGRLGFTVPPSTTASLAELGLPRAQWPQIGMKNTALNQDGCKDAELTFGFEASDTGPTG